MAGQVKDDLGKEGIKITLLSQTADCLVPVILNCTS